jgi:hypothetical protein
MSIYVSIERLNNFADLFQQSLVLFEEVVKSYNAVKKHAEVLSLPFEIEMQDCHSNPFFVSEQQKKDIRDQIFPEKRIQSFDTITENMLSESCLWSYDVAYMLEKLQYLVSMSSSIASQELVNDTETKRLEKEAEKEARKQERLAAKKANDSDEAEDEEDEEEDEEEEEEEDVDEEDREIGAESIHEIFAEVPEEVSSGDKISIIDRLEDCCFCKSKCPFTSVDEVTVNLHLLRHAAKGLAEKLPLYKPYTCPDCSLEFRNRHLLIVHFGITHGHLEKIVHDELDARKIVLTNVKKTRNIKSVINRYTLPTNSKRYKTVCLLCGQSFSLSSLDRIEIQEKMKISKDHTLREDLRKDCPQRRQTVLYLLELVGSVYRLMTLLMFLVFFTFVRTIFLASSSS